MTTTTPRTDALEEKMYLEGLPQNFRSEYLFCKCRDMERDLAAAQEENAKLKAEITRVMQAAANGGYCRRNHAKCECENIAESIRIDE